MGSPVEGKRKARSVAGLVVSEKLVFGPFVERLAVIARIFDVFTEHYVQLRASREQAARCDIVQRWACLFPQMFKCSALGAAVGGGCCCHGHWVHKNSPLSGGLKLIV